MKFPYRRSPGQDLRDLFGIEQVRSRSRDLGRSSLRQGEGALRLLSSDGSSTLAVLGDLPGGGFGVGVPGPNGSIVTVQQSISASTSGLTSRVDWLDGQMTNANTGLSDLRGRAGSLEAFQAYGDRQITKFENNLNGEGGLNGFRAYADGQITGINSNLGTLNGFRSYADGQITGLNNTASSHNTRINSANAAISEVRGDLSSVASTAASNLTSAVNALRSRDDNILAALKALRNYVNAQHPGAPVMPD